MDTLSEERIKSIVEYNLKKFRIGGIEYKSGYNTDDPQGIQGLITDDTKLKRWSNKPDKKKTGNETKYNLVETNIQMRDFLTQIILDIFAGADSSGNYSKSNNNIYNIIPSNGSSTPNNTKPFKIVRGDTTFEVRTDGIYINGILFDPLGTGV